jgi:YidC/Oxa1 family membrane protein insertase
MIAVAIVQAVLDGLGQLLAWIYEVVPNYGVAIIAFTILIRLVLLPLGIKQIRSMHEMQAIQPEVRRIQQKYKGNRQRMNEEVMKLYQEHGVNPLGGCWPLLLQLPVFFALFAVLRAPTVAPSETDPSGYEIQNNHIPEDSRLFRDVIRNQHAPFVGGNLLCNALEAGRDVTVRGSDGEPIPENEKIDNVRECGNGIPSRVPYYAFALLMVGTSYYQQRQMQRAQPPGAQTQQMQTMMRVMPLLFGFWGFIFPAGLVVYWTTSNLWQIGQQHFLIKARREMDEKGGPLAARKKPARKGLMARMMEQAQTARDQQAAPRPKPAGQKPGSGSEGDGEAQPKPAAGSRKPSSGGKGAGSRKKRRKR